jgi:hypothetical protein
MVIKSRKVTGVGAMDGLWPTQRPVKISAVRAVLRKSDITTRNAASGARHRIIGVFAVNEYGAGFPAPHGSLKLVRR